MPESSAASKFLRRFPEPVRDNERTNERTNVERDPVEQAQAVTDIPPLLRLIELFLRQDGKILDCGQRNFRLLIPFVALTRRKQRDTIVKNIWGHTERRD